MLKTTYTLHDLTISLACSDPELRQLLQATLAYKGATPFENEEAGASDIELVFHLEDDLPCLSEEARLLREQDHQIEVFGEGGAYYLRHPDAVVHISPEAQRVEGHVRRGLAVRRADQPPTLFYLLIVSLVVLLQRRDIVVVHAAALARNDRGVLLIGHSGSGKTTTAFNLVRQGWGYLSDDTLLLRRRGGRVEALPFRKEFCILPEMAARFPELRDADWPPSLSNPAKWSIDMGALYGAPRVVQCEPALLLFTGVEADEPTRLQPMSDKEAFVRLVYQTALHLTRDAHSDQLHMRMLRDLIAQTSAHSMLLGRDVLEQPDRLDALVAGVLDREHASL